jgi:hypothetical protein
MLRSDVARTGLLHAVIQSNHVVRFEGVRSLVTPHAPRTYHGGGVASSARKFAGAPLPISSIRETIVVTALRCARFRALRLENIARQKAASAFEPQNCRGWTTSLGDITIIGKGVPRPGSHLALDLTWGGVGGFRSQLRRISTRDCSRLRKRSAQGLNEDGQSA